MRKLHGPTEKAVAPDNNDPDARAKLFQDDVARHFEQEVTPEESAGRHAVSRRIEAEILVHGERREADIDAIEIAEKINQDGQRAREVVTAEAVPTDVRYGKPLTPRVQISDGHYDALRSAWSCTHQNPGTRAPSRQHVLLLIISCNVQILKRAFRPTFTPPARSPRARERCRRRSRR